MPKIVQLRKVECWISVRQWVFYMDAIDCHEMPTADTSDKRKANRPTWTRFYSFYSHVGHATVVSSLFTLAVQVAPDNIAVTRQNKYIRWVHKLIFFYSVATQYVNCSVSLTFSFYPLILMSFPLVRELYIRPIATPPQPHGVSLLANWLTKRW